MGLIFFLSPEISLTSLLFPPITPLFVHNVSPVPINFLAFFFYFPPPLRKASLPESHPPPHRNVFPLRFSPSRFQCPILRSVYQPLIPQLLVFPKSPLVLNRRKIVNLAFAACSKSTDLSSHFFFFGCANLCPRQ